MSTQGERQHSFHIEETMVPWLGRTAKYMMFFMWQRFEEMGVNITVTSGPALEKGGDLLGILTHLEGGDILFIDEMHRLPRVVEEFLYPAMEDFAVDFIFDKGIHARSHRYRLERFVLVGATTRAGSLSPPLRERFGDRTHLAPSRSPIPTWGSERPDSSWNDQPKSWAH